MPLLFAIPLAIIFPFWLRIYIRRPDYDRSLAYPGQPELWSGIIDVDAADVTLSWVQCITSLFFWLTYFSIGLFLILMSGPLVREDGALAYFFLAGWALAVLPSFLICKKFGRRGAGGLRVARAKKSSLLDDVQSDARRPRVLFICGSLNQTTQMHAISRELDKAFPGGILARYTPYYSDHWFFRWGLKLGVQEGFVSGYKRRRFCFDYLNQQNLPVDLHGERHMADYDLVLTCNDQILPPNIKNKPLVLVQEGIMEPPNFLTKVCRVLPFFPRVVAGTSTTGWSKKWMLFCVASEGYREAFIKDGLDASKIVATGIPNFDNCKQYYQNNFPHRDYVMVGTSDNRESMAWQREDRVVFIRRCVGIAKGRQLIFKLHPNEDLARATREIHSEAPNALIFQKGSAEEMIANCAVLVTQWSSITFVGLALEKEVHTNLDMDQLKRLLPVQNGGTSAHSIAGLCADILHKLPKRALNTSRPAFATDNVTLDTAG